MFIIYRQDGDTEAGDPYWVPINWSRSETRASALARRDSVRFGLKTRVAKWTPRPRGMGKR